MNPPASHPPILRVLVTGISGNLGCRLAPLLQGYELYSADLYPPPPGVQAGEFHRVDLSTGAGQEELGRLVREAEIQAVLHLAFVVDQVRSGILERERMRRTNVDGTRRLLEAVAARNRDAAHVRLFVYLSSVSAYGPELPPMSREDAPLEARSLPYALDKRETDLLCQQMFPQLNGCALYIFRPPIFAARTVQNWLVDGIRGRASGRGWLARLAQRRGWRVPVLLPTSADGNNQFQFVHVDDVARILAWTLRSFSENKLEIFNLPGEGTLTLQESARLAGTPLVHLPGEVTVRFLLRFFYLLGLSAVPPEALPYFTGTYTMDNSRLRAALSEEYEEVMRHSTREALEDAVGGQTVMRFQQ
jgi:nucleoside-diphosphate-sugar epimerase